MKTVLLMLLLVGSLVASAQPTQSQIPEAGGTKNYTLLLKDGSQVTGRIVRRDSANIVVRQRNGRLTYVDLELFDRVMSDSDVTPTALVSAYTNAPTIDTTGLKNYVILFKDGSQITGRIVRRDSTTWVIKPRRGDLTYADPTLVDRIVITKEHISRQTPLGNPFAAFMTLNQTAYTADPGKLYYRNVWLAYNELNYGISRNWSIGTIIIPALWLLPESPFTQSIGFSTKVSFPLGDAVRIGGNAIYQPSRTYELFKLTAVWNLQAIASLGDAQRNITLGYGRVSYGDNKRNRQPYFTVSAMVKLSSGLSFITDNTLYTNQNSYSSTASVFSAAIRFDRPRHTFDLGVLGQTYNNDFFGRSANPNFYPYLAYNLRIGR